MLTHEAMEGIAVLLADMSHESVELINRLDVLDIVAVFKAFFSFFTQRQFSQQDNLGQN